MVLERDLMQELRKLYQITELDSPYIEHLPMLNMGVLARRIELN